jgi:hypothetical protein
MMAGELTAWPVKTEDAPNMKKRAQGSGAMLPAEWV